MKSFLKVFAIIYAPFMVSMLLLHYFSNSLLLESANEELLKEIRNKWQVLSLLRLQDMDATERHRLIAGIWRETKLRTTLISKDGTVIDDSAIAPEKIGLMRNHANRPEVIEAVDAGEGYFLRYSSTMDFEMLYFAGKLSDDLVLRLAYPTSYLMKLRREYSRRNLNIFLFLFVVTTAVALYLARKLTLPVRHLNAIAEEIESGKREIRFPSFRDETMGKVSDLIRRIYKAMLFKQEQLIREQSKSNYVYNLLEEGIVLLNESNEVLHFNKKAKEYLDIDLREGDNIVTDTEDREISAVLGDILSSTNNNVWKEREIKSRLYNVNLRIGVGGTLDGQKESAKDGSKGSEKLIVFFDITEKTKYRQYKTKLIENISHELRTPLSMIMGYAETIIHDPDMPGERVRQFLERIYRNSKQINDTISNVLQLHKLESMEEQPQNESSADTQILLSDLEALYSNRKEKSISFEFVPARVNMKYEHLFSIFSNLIGNAVQYSEGSNIVASLQLMESRIELRVEDEGPPIPQDLRERVFERFYTVSKSRNKHHAGTGLGLPIVKHIAQLYGGNVRVVESVKHGNVFSVNIPQRT